MAYMPHTILACMCVLVCMIRPGVGTVDFKQRAHVAIDQITATNVIYNRTAHVNIEFHFRNDVTVRWFREFRTQKRNSEFLPVEGDGRYKVWTRLLGNPTDEFRYGQATVQARHVMDNDLTPRLALRVMMFAADGHFTVSADIRHKLTTDTSFQKLEFDMPTIRSFPPPKLQVRGGQEITLTWRVVTSRDPVVMVTREKVDPEGRLGTQSDVLYTDVAMLTGAALPGSGQRRMVHFTRRLDDGRLESVYEFHISSVRAEDEAGYLFEMILGEETDSLAIQTDLVLGRGDWRSGSPVVYLEQCAKIKEQSPIEITDRMGLLAGTEDCVSCLGYGPNVLSVHMYRGGRALVPFTGHTLNTYSPGPHLLKTTWTFLNPSLEDEGEFECRVTNGVDMISRDFDVILIEPVRLRFLVQGWNSSELSVVCVALGRPVPHLRIQRLQLSGQYRDVTSWDVGVQHLDVFRRSINGLTGYVARLVLRQEAGDIPDDAISCRADSGFDAASTIVNLAPHRPTR